MPVAILAGPALGDVHNAVLRRALIHSTVTRTVSQSDYHKVEVGVREGAFTTWVGTWDGSKQKIEVGTPIAILDVSREGMRMKAGQSIVLRVTSYGVPASLLGCRVTLTFAHVGGRTGAAKPLVSAGATVADPQSRAPIAVLERQINTSLSEWEESVEVEDPVGLGTVATFHGRMQRDSATQISLQRYVGNWIEVDGEFLSMGSGGIACTTTNGVLTASGGLTSTAPSTSTLYYVYVGTLPGSVPLLRLSETAPSRYLGTYYLGSTEGARRWRFVGWAYLNGSTQFTDSVTAREVINYYHRRRLKLFTCPAYADNNTETTYTNASIPWIKLNAAVGSDVTFITNGEDLIDFVAVYRAVNDTPGSSHGPAIGYDGVTVISVAGECAQVGDERVHISVPDALVAGTPARRTASILGRVSAGISTIYADVARNGAAADPAETYLLGWVNG